MEYLYSALIGYLLGSLSPSALLSRMKHKNIRNSGTGNLGASNVMLNFGKGLGVLVMLFDIAKAFFAIKLTAWLFPQQVCVGMLTGLSAILGHNFPFYLKFKGGKGLATFAGMVMAYNPLLFLFLLISGCILMILVNYSFIMPFYASTFFAVFVAVDSRNLPLSLICAAASVLIMIMHAGNIKKAMDGKDYKIRDLIKKMAHGAETEETADEKES